MPFVLIVLVAWGTVLEQGRLPDIGRIERKTGVILVAAGIPPATSSLLVFQPLSLGDASRVSPMTNVAPVFPVTLAAIFTEGETDVANGAGGRADAVRRTAHCLCQAG